MGGWGIVEDRTYRWETQILYGLDNVPCEGRKERGREWGMLDEDDSHTRDPVILVCSRELRPGPAPEGLNASHVSDVTAETN